MLRPTLCHGGGQGGGHNGYILLPTWLLSHYIALPTELLSHVIQ